VLNTLQPERLLITSSDIVCPFTFAVVSGSVEVVASNDFLYLQSLDKVIIIFQTAVLSKD
jgi:hypothetical protein